MDLEKSNTYTNKSVQEKNLLKETLKKINKARKTATLLLGIHKKWVFIILFVSIPIISFLVLSLLLNSIFYKAKISESVYEKPTSTPWPEFKVQPTEVPTPTLQPFIETEDFKLRQFDPNSKKSYIFDIWKVEYPKEITNVNDSQLTPLSCTHNYWGRGMYELLEEDSVNISKFFYTSDKNGKDYSMSDQKLIEYVKFLHKKYPRIKSYRNTTNRNNTKYILACSTEAGKTLVFYGIGAKGGGDYVGDPYLGIDNGKGIEETVSLEKTYGTCRPIQLVNNEYLYLECGTPYEGGGVIAILQVNLSNRSVTRLLYCIAGFNIESTCK